MGNQLDILRRGVDLLVACPGRLIDHLERRSIDLSGIARAVWVTIRSGGQSRQGASTLTQQLARSGLLGIGKE
ncbi:transglycosylase domain-containing protein, partial [Enterobacter hormaechei]|uniref:transglycosylase domain-containing protein n=1 Tax=Enterobacter hormaechei TaxID=158836 RepID=UPI001952C6F9